MLASGLLPILSAYWPLILVAGVVIRLLRNKYHNGLNKYPGNALAAYTNWWRYFDVRGRRAQWTHIDLHRKHGDIVRLGPNVLSFADPRAIKTIYGLNKGMTKARIFTSPLILQSDPNNIAVRVLSRPNSHCKRSTNLLPIQHNRRRIPCKVPSMRQQCLLHVFAGQLRTAS
jgi:hypothetical protein